MVNKECIIDRSQREDFEIRISEGKQFAWCYYDDHCKYFVKCSV